MYFRVYPAGDDAAYSAKWRFQPQMLILGSFRSLTTRFPLLHLKLSLSEVALDTGNNRQGRHLPLAPFLERQT